MTQTAIATPDDENARAVLEAASDVIESASAAVLVEIAMAKMARVGVMLKSWHEMMDDAGYTNEWIEARATDVFHGFFPPYEPPCCCGEYDDDDDD